MQHRFAYIGTDLQDIYGVHAHASDHDLQRRSFELKDHA
ncbi:hypothetical protein ABIB27_001023 [Arthrobacter sp. UYEF21]